MTENVLVDKPKKNTRRAFSFMASLAMLGVGFPSEKKSERIELPTKGMKGLSNAELKTSGKRRKKKRKRK